MSPQNNNLPDNIQLQNSIKNNLRWEITEFTKYD